MSFWRAVRTLLALQSVEFVSLQPHDVVLVTVKGPISTENAERVRGYCKQLWPYHPVAVVDDTTKISVFRAAPPAQDEVGVMPDMLGNLFDLRLLAEWVGAGLVGFAIAWFVVRRVC